MVHMSAARRRTSYIRSATMRWAIFISFDSAARRYTSSLSDLDWISARRSILPRIGCESNLNSSDSIECRWRRAVFRHSHMCDGRDHNRIAWHYERRCRDITANADSACLTA
jgi:hypothetical protein